MVSTYRARADELDESLLNSIKLAYLNKNIQIIVSEVNSLSDAELAKRIYEVDNNINLVKFTPDEFDKFVNELS
ncbi:MAG: hypothetical protein RO257_14905 [Candidatus Kapabacteria bacterium]|nr:hypothetical protein [Candidatus Kapabacteria bacterium]